MARSQGKAHRDGDGLRWEKRHGHWEQVCLWNRSGRCTHVHAWNGVALLTSGPPPPEHHDHWGHWFLDAERQEIVYFTGPIQEMYWIELARARSYTDQGKWLRHMAEKTWMKRGDLDDLATAMLACEDVPLQRQQSAM